MPQFGPGTLQIGATGSEHDASCLINSCRITNDKETGDSTTKLCGTVRPGKTTYTYTLTGNIDVDSDDADGLFALTQDSPGAQVPFTFTPSTESGTTATGTLTLDPLDFGADEFGDDLTSDFEFALVGKPVYSYGGGGAGELSIPAPATRLIVNGSGAPAQPAADLTQPAAVPEDDDVVDEQLQPAST